MIPELRDVDRRPSLLLGWTPENIALVTREWPRSDATPEAVADMLAEPRRLFVGASMCYDNLTAASLKALQAAEYGLRLRLGIAAGARMTFGQLLKSRGIDGVLNPRQRDWYQEFALHFRNTLAHPHGAVAFSPGIAEPILRTAHEMISQLFPPPASAVC